MRPVNRAIAAHAMLCLLVIIGCSALVSNAALAADTGAQKANSIPATDSTWKSIDQNLAELGSLIAAGKLDDLGRSAYGIANLVKTLPGQSGSLPPADLAKVSGSVKVVGGLVTKLDKAGEKGDKAGVHENLAALEGTLNDLRQLYFR